MASLNVGGLGEYLREQRRTAKLSLRQLADAAGVSNPYLSQIERGLRKPSAEILQQLAKALRISAETLYVQAGILDERDREGQEVRQAILIDPMITERQKQVLLQIYESFRKENAVAADASAADASAAARIAQDGATGGPAADDPTTPAAPGTSAAAAGAFTTAAPEPVRGRAPGVARQPADGTAVKRTTAKKAAKKAARSAAAKVAETVAGRNGRAERQLRAVPVEAAGTGPTVPVEPAVPTVPAVSAGSDGPPGPDDSAGGGTGTATA